ncbi:MAG: hemolysin family protein [Candidatus Brocadiia bacterium]
MISAPETILLIVLFGCTTFTSLAELAIASVNAVRMKTLAEKGSRPAGVVLYIRSRPDMLFGTLLVANTIINTLITVLISWAFIRLATEGPLNGHSERLIQAITSLVCIASISLLEVFAKTLATARAERMALFSAYPVQMLIWALFPAVKVFTWLSNRMCALFGVKPEFEQGNTSIEDVRAVIRNAGATGLVESEDSRTMERITMMDELTARDVLVPRTDMVALPMRMSCCEAAMRVVTQRYSRFPVYGRDLDDIVGVLHSKDLIACAELENIVILHDIIYPARFVPDSSKLRQLLKTIRREHSQLLIVVDEFGQTAGIVTLEDVIEELFGEIEPADGERGGPLQRNEDGSITVDGRVAVRYLNEEFGLDISSPAVSIGGHILHVLGRLPVAGEHVSFAGLSVEVQSLHGRRILRAIIRPAAKDVE